MKAYSYLRFSTPEQALGDSERRQVEKAEAWAAAKCIPLDKSYADRGKSGFKGTNRKRGALGRFLKQIKAGNGSALPQDAYDFDGNLKSGRLPANQTENSGLTWDAENRLVEVRVGTNGPLVRYAYDSQSRRIARSVGTSTTIYLYDGWNVIAEYEGAGLAKTYIWGTDLSGTMQGAGGVGGLLAVKSVSVIHYPTFDGNGNVSEYLDGNGAPAAHFEYDPFGNTVVNTDTAGLFPYRFSTKPIDAATGLYYYGYRYYDPETGRWPSRDPIEEEGGLNPYGFVGNNGVDNIDKLGLIPVETVVDVCSIGTSAYDLYSDPSWGNFGFLCWDLAATCVPYVPGSYVGKAAKGCKKVTMCCDNAEDAAEAARKAKQIAERQRKLRQQEMKQRQTEPNPHKGDKDPCKTLCWALKRAKDVLEMRENLAACFPMENDPHDHPGQIEARRRAVDNAQDAVDKAGCKCEKYDFWN